ncbi:M20 family metallo-hydrolase [Oxyplasma meridianum]|uniref:M20 family metallo-hydrolase n=1 Tax=Oxyplasma meridianum TaxID=3073602 RepID=A0AAX4NI50_9ARCH
MINTEEKSVDNDFVIEVARRLIPIKSISPESGGDGESRRAEEICRILDELGYSDYKKYETTDKHNIVRPSVILKVGNCKKTLWLISHIDTVPEGDLSLWKYKPFEATVEGNRIYGRGSSDDGQAVFLSLLILKNLKKEKLKYNLGLAFVADEEVGSKYGISFLLEKDIFKRDDLFIVPDAGTEDGLEIEIAEKSILWIKFRTMGKQYHASMPAEAINANRETMKFILQLDEMLHSKYTDTSDIFNPPYSTFEPTKHEKNVDNVNTIPGVEVQYVDCRILPKYHLDQVIKDIEALIDNFNKTSKAKVSYELFQKEQAPNPTDENSTVVMELKEAIRKVKGKDPRVVGIGGGTCAAFFRRRGMDAAVWSTTMENVAHQPDEYCIIDHILVDQKVIEEMIYSP